jgi:apolipoprotein N-acyltransferase
MKQRLTHISPHQTAKTLAFIYGLIGIIVSLIVWVASFTTPVVPWPRVLILLFPIIYACIGYVFIVIFAAIYNAIAQISGGIEFTLSAIGESEPPV